MSEWEIFWLASAWVGLVFTGLFVLAGLVALCTWLSRVFDQRSPGNDSVLDEWPGYL